MICYVIPALLAYLFSVVSSFFSTIVFYFSPSFPLMLQPNRYRQHSLNSFIILFVSPHRLFRFCSLLGIIAHSLKLKTQKFTFQSVRNSNQSLFPFISLFTTKLILRALSTLNVFTFIISRELMLNLWLDKLSLHVF